MFSVDWLISYGATPAVVIIFVMGVMFSLYVINKDKNQREEIKDLWTEIKELRAEIKDLSSKYHQVDKLTYGAGIAIKKHTGISIQNQSADGRGENSLNRDVEL